VYIRRRAKSSAANRGPPLPVSPAREIAYRILRRVESGRSYAVDLLQGPDVSRLKEADRRLATELVMGVLRWCGELDFQIEQLSGRPLERFDPEIVTILRLGVYQIRFLGKIPKSAAVNEAVELAKMARKRSAAGLVNAVLRKCPPPEPQELAIGFESLDASGRESIRRSVPGWLFERWAEAQREGNRPEAALQRAWASVQHPLTTLRVTQGLSRETVAAELAAEGIQTRLGQFSGHALVVESGNVLSSAALCEGRLVIQDEASQLVPELLAVALGQRVLDLCAAPGIKARQIAESLTDGLLVACDLSARRLRTMERLLGPRVPDQVRVATIRLDGTRPLPFRCEFGRILLDVPCSGTGTLARNPEIKWRLRPQDLPRLAEAQRKMLRNALEVLAPRGRLVYSTCSLEQEENEQVVEAVLAEVKGFRRLAREELSNRFPTLAALFDSRGYFHTDPATHGMDGFFAAVMVRE
jgi:16S rRNA (cytosine967-C5)-methyltransferase